jgi:hypothetical protein
LGDARLLPSRAVNAVLGGVNLNRDALFPGEDWLGFGIDSLRLYTRTVAYLSRLAKLIGIIRIGEAAGVESRQAIFEVGIGYDAQERMTLMTNWALFPTAGARVTSWNYDGYRGWLNSKQYDDNKEPVYSYTNSGRLAGRLLARGTNTTYGYTQGFVRGSGSRLRLWLILVRGSPLAVAEPSSGPAPRAARMAGKKERQLSSPARLA